MNDVLDEQLRDLGRTLGRAQASANRLAWRQAMACRCSIVAAVLRLTVGTDGSRARHPTGWVVYDANGDVVALVGSRTRRRTLAELRAPLVVRVDRNRMAEAIVRRLTDLGAIVLDGVDGGSKS